MRIITPDFLYDLVYKNIIESNFKLEDNIFNKIKNSIDNETENSQKFLDYIIKNCDIAKTEIKIIIVKNIAGATNAKKTPKLVATLLPPFHFKKTE